MDRVQLGQTGWEITRIGLGGMPLSIQGRPEREPAKRVVRRAVELGVNFIDTADVYCLGEGDLHHNEALIREALDEYQGPGSGEVVIATKAGMTRPEGRWEKNGRPKHIRAACERSLKALRADAIDLYQFHVPDPEVPFEDSVGEFSRLQEDGKLRAVGLSNVDVDQIRTAQEIVQVTSVQNRFNPWDRSDEESGLIGFCHENGITYLPYSPVGGGRRVNLLRESEPLRAIGARFGATPEELVLGWILSKSPSLAAIPGARRVESIESSVRAEDLRLDPEVVEEVEEAYRSLPD